MNIDLQINRINISLGRSVDQTLEFSGDYFQKINFISKLLIKTPLKDEVYFAKNCAIQCFNEAFTVVAFIEKGFPAEMLFGTSAYLYFKNNDLYKVTFQVIHSKNVAKKSAYEFRELCRKIFGEPTDKGDFLEIWEDAHSILVSTWSEGASNAKFSWVKT